MGLRGLKTAYLLVLTVLAVCQLLSCSNSKKEVPYYHTADFTPVWESRQPDTLHKIAAFSFTDQLGNTITNQSFNNKIYVANFFFTSCPGVCPKMAANLKIVADSFKQNERVAFISHSVTPDVDSVPKLLEYAKDRSIDATQWHLVTGNKKAIYTLARTSYFAEEQMGLKAEPEEFLHTEHMLLVDGQGHLRGVYNGTLLLEMNRMMEDINKLLKE